MRRIIYAIVIAFHFHFFLYKICKYILSCFMLYNESLKSVQNKKSYHLNSYRIAMSNKHLRLINLKCLVSKQMVFLPVGKCFYYKILRCFLHITTSMGKNVCVWHIEYIHREEYVCVTHGNLTFVFFQECWTDQRMNIWNGIPGHHGFTCGRGLAGSHFS